MAREVAVGVLEDGEGRVLMAQRPAHKPLPLLWEFPGGKIEHGESAAEAVRRELREEVGVEALDGTEAVWLTALVSYGAFHVRVHFFRIRHWRGDARPAEGQALAWEALPVRCAPVLKGALPALRRLAEERGLDPATVAPRPALAAPAAEARSRLGEGPVHAPPYVVYVDIAAHELRALHVAAATHHHATLPGPVSCVVPRRHRPSSYVVAIADAVALVDVDWPANTLLSLTYVTRAVFPPAVPMRFNDGKADPAGRLWVGSMDLLTPHAPHAALYSLDPRAAPPRLAERVSGAIVSNGLAWQCAPGGEWTMYWADTDTQTVWAFAWAPATGALSARRAAVHVPRALGRPDGLCVDSEGMLWVALLQGGAVGRFDPATGELLHTVRVPGASLVTSVCFAGPRLTDLYVTTGSWRLAPAALASPDECNAGRLFVVRDAASAPPPDHYDG